MLSEIIANCLIADWYLQTAQFFQFDRNGNTFIFACGTGCTGQAKLVQPGDELIFCSTHEWDQREGPSIMVPDIND